MITDYSKPFLYKGEWYKAEKDKYGNCKGCAFQSKVRCPDLPIEMTNYCFYHCMVYHKIRTSLPK